MVQNYDAINMAEMEEEAERFDEQGEQSNNDFLEKFVIMPEKEGFVVVRLLPPAKGKKFYCATRTHKLAKPVPGDPTKKRGRNFHCPRELVTAKNGKKIWVDSDPKCPCPVCMWTRGIWADVEAAGGRETAEGKIHHAEYSRIKAIERYYYNGIVRIYNKKGEFERNEGPKILSVGKTLHERIVRAIIGDPKAGPAGKGLGDVSDLKNGRDFCITKKFRSGSDFPYYDESKFQDPSPLGTPDEIEQWLANLHDLAALRVVRPMEELDIALQKYTGALPDDDVSFDRSKYVKKAATLDEQVAEEKKKATAVAPAAKAESKPATKPAVKSSDEILAEPNFLDGLNDKLKGM
jgi:gp32 DNA binding protein like